MSNASVWAPGLAISGHTLSASQRIVLAAGQTIVDITDFVYTPNVGSIEVYKNGLLKNIVVDWNERDDGSSVVLTSPAVSGDVLTVTAHVGITAAVPLASGRQVALNGGVWEAGQAFIAYNQYMIYSGEAYSPLPATALPYTVGASPDLGFVYQVKLNSLQALSGLTEPSDLAQRHRIKTTVAEIATGVFKAGDSLEVTDRAGAKFEVVSGGTPDGFGVLDAGNGNTAKITVSEATDGRSYGAKEDESTEDTDAYQAYFNEVGPIQDLIIGDSVIGALTFPGKKSFNIKLKGNVKVKDEIAATCLTLGAIGKEKHQVNINLNGFNIDCNYQNQSAKYDFIQSAYIKCFLIYNGTMSNVSKTALTCNVSSYFLHYIKNVKITDGALHTGIVGGGTTFISLFGGAYTIIEECNFKQTADPIGSQNRNPGGVFISGSNGNKRVSVTDCEFDNLGHNVAGNLESPLDLYSYAAELEYRRNKFTKSRFNAFRATNCGTAIIVGNEVLQNVPIINDGGGNYSDAACLTVGLVPRSFTVNNVENDTYEIRGNTLVVDGVPSCGGIVAATNSASFLVRTVVVENNTIKYKGVGSTNNGILFTGIKESYALRNKIRGFNQHIVCQQTDTLSAILAGLGESNICKFEVTGGELKGSPASAIFVRTGVTNLSTKIHKVDLTNAGALCFSVRNSKSLHVSECDMPTNGNGDTSANGAFYYWNNIVQFATDPVGAASNTYYRLYNNVGRADIISA